MKKVFSYLLNITGYILISAFIVISVTENTSYVDKYYKNSIIAKKNGVKFIAFSCEVSQKGIDVIQQIKINEN